MKRRALGWALALITFACTMYNQRSVGIARDETVYMAAGERYADWWLGLATFSHGIDAKSITATFGGAPGGPTNSEHPPLMKTADGLAHWLLADKLGIVDELTAFRVPTALAHAALVVMVYTMTLELWGLAEAVLAALCLLLLPRALFHAGLAAFDAPIMTMWFATIYAYWRCLDRTASPSGDAAGQGRAPAGEGRKWPWQVGVAFGLALATKHNAVLLPFALGAHYTVLAVRQFGWRPLLAAPAGLLAYRGRVVLSFVVLGPLVLFALWPWLWLDPIGHVVAWLGFHFKHVHYNYEYLGKNWNAPPFPWHVALVTTLFTVPVVTLLAAALGAGVWIANGWRGATRDRLPALLLGLSAAASIGPFLLGTTPIFGAEKHWMPALPTICIAAGVGAGWAARRATQLAIERWRISEPLARIAALWVVGVAIVVAAGSETLASRPYALSWYNAAAGGVPGGADLGMNRQFWGVAARGVLPFIASQPPGPVYSHDASPAWGWYKKLGLLPAGYPDSGNEVAGIERSKLALVIHELHFNRHDYLIWKSYGTVQPVFVLRFDGVPIVSVYERPR